MQLISIAIAATGIRGRREEYLSTLYYRPQTSRIGRIRAGERGLPPVGTQFNYVLAPRIIPGGDVAIGVRTSVKAGPDQQKKKKKQISQLSRTAPVSLLEDAHENTNLCNYTRATRKRRAGGIGKDALSRLGCCIERSDRRRVILAAASAAPGSGGSESSACEADPRPKVHRGTVGSGAAWPRGPARTGAFVQASILISRESWDRG